ncbi:MAG: CobD/CbiB family protein [Betaproteobacteria bacterium]|nr:CobD/CbiB family protein [Betaproteobacteria bacterium]
MSVLAIVAALLIEQWRPLGDRRFYLALLAGWAAWLERSFNAGEARQGNVAWMVAVLPAVCGAILAHALFTRMGLLFSLAFDVAALYFTLGFRQSSHYFTDIKIALDAGDLDRACDLIAQWRMESPVARSREEVIGLAIEQALLASHRHVFGVLLWYLVLPGPSGAILYRLAAYLHARWSGMGAFGRLARQAFALLEWPAVRLTGVAFAVVGDFEDAIYCWRSQARAWSDPNAGIVLSAGAGALGVHLGGSVRQVEGAEVRPDLGLGEVADRSHLDSTVGLVWRALVLWVFVLVVLTGARWVA